MNTYPQTLPSQTAEDGFNGLAVGLQQGSSKSNRRFFTIVWRILSGRLLLSLLVVVVVGFMTGHGM